MDYQLLYRLPATFVSEKEERLWLLLEARVVQATTKSELPENFQTVEWQKEKGQVDIVLDRKDILPTIEKLLSILLKKNSAISTEENETSENSQSLTKSCILKK